MLNTQRLLLLAWDNLGVGIIVFITTRDKHYCDEAIELYFRIVNTILFSTHEDDLRAGMEHLKNQTLLDEYFVYGYGAHHLWVCQRRASDKSKIFEHRILIARF